MKRLSRATALKIAAILSLTIGVYAFFALLPYLAGGAAGDIDIEIDFTFFIVVFIFAILRIVGAYGAWLQQRWGILLTLLANLLDGLLALPGLLFAPNLGWWLSALVGVVGSALIIVLCLWRDRQPAPHSLEVN